MQQKYLKYTRWFILTLAFYLVACQSEPPTPVVVTQIVEVFATVPVTATPPPTAEPSPSPTPIEVTRIVEVVTTPTPTPFPQGGTITHATIDEPTTLNPILAGNDATNQITSLLYLSLIDLDPFTGALIGEIASDWTVSPDGRTYTFNLRDDILWSDDTPLTAADISFTFDAITHANNRSPWRTRLQGIDSWTATSASTFTLKFNQADCTILPQLTMGILPAHAFDNDVTILAPGQTFTPNVTNGPFLFTTWQPTESITLSAYDNYYLGRPNIDQWQQRFYPDSQAQLQAFLDGQADYLSVAPHLAAVIEGEIANNKPINIRRWYTNGNTFLAFNLANPEQPQNGWDDQNNNGLFDGNEPPLTQSPHPILADLAVRQAIAHAIDYTDIINKVAYGEAGRTVANVWPSIEWAYNQDIPLNQYDIDLAQTILEDAGWTDTDEDGFRERDGQSLRLTLITNETSETRTAIAELLKEELAVVGIDINIELLPFDALTDALLGQTFDLTLIGLGGGAPEPDDSDQFSYHADFVGVGFNFVSYYNEQVEANLEAGRTIPDCTPDARAPFYQENQEIMHAELPYIWLYTAFDNTVWHQDIHQFNPSGWQFHNQIHQWYRSNPTTE
ncbi:MAG TPA: ABC transporter substrate-binding protein [Anaerolineae bacterium]|nr:ABC transporter substrate-binding protein [Anaerolineae bacterium]